MTGGVFLKPCRCGGRAGLSHANGLFWAFCCDCGATGPTGTKASAIRGWNEPQGQAAA